MPLYTGQPPVWEPTTDQIAETCRQIQATWSAEERARRSRYYSGGHDLGIRVRDTTLLRRIGEDVGGG